VILIGLGSNKGDRIGFLRRAVKELIQREIIFGPIRVSRIYASDALLPSEAPDSWNMEFLNGVVSAQTRLAPRKFLEAIKQIEKDLGREDRERWAPREIDIDILWMKNVSISETDLHIPHSGLLFRPFWLAPLAELKTELPMNGGLVNVEQLARDMTSLAARPLPVSLLPVEFMGIVNVTPDSFSDGGLYQDSISAFRRIRELVDEGASLIDIGAESTRPGAKSIGAKEEWSRLESIVKEVRKSLSAEYPWVKWSIDTRYFETAKRASEFGIQWINDVTGGENSHMVELLQSSDCDVVFMHQLGVPVDPDRVIPSDQDPVDFLVRWANERILFFESWKIDRQRLIFDPGIGFGKTADQSIEILSRLHEFKALGLRTLVGHSRKSFLKQISKHEARDRDLETQVVSTSLIGRGVDYLRVHDVKGHDRAIRARLLIEA